MSKFYQQQADRAYSGSLQEEAASQTQYVPNLTGGLVGEQLCERTQLGHIIDRINDCIDIASKSAERISIIADRVNGATPANAPNGPASSIGPGLVCEIHSRIDTLANILAATCDEVGRLETL